MPKLVADQLLIRSLLQVVFPGCDITNIEAQRLQEKLIQGSNYSRYIYIYIYIN